MKILTISRISHYIALLLALLLLSLLPDTGFSSESGSPVSSKKQKITINKTAKIADNALVTGTVSFKKKMLFFKGKYRTVEDSKIFINWFSVNKKNFKPYFKSVFKTKNPALKKGQKLSVVGNFEKLYQKLFNNSPEDSGSSSDEETSTGSDSESSTGSTDSSSSSNDTSSGSNGGATPTTPTNPTTNDTTVTVSSRSEESCPSEEDGSQIHIRQKTITTYSDGSSEEGPCNTIATYDLIDTYEDCSPRNDFVASVTHLQQKTGYVNDDGNFVMTKSCHDTNTTFPHLKIASDCDEYYDKSNNLIYQAKKTYYTDTNGSINFISACKIDSTDFRSVSADDYLKEYSNSDRVDMPSLMAFKRFKFYVQLGSSKVYVSDWQDDLVNPMPIQKSYNSCPYYHDINAASSLRQYQYVYSSDGLTKPVSECTGDPNLTFSHVTDEKFCTPHIVNRRIYKKISTYFLDETSKRVVVSDCSLTNTELPIDPAYITKNYSKCKPRVDLSQMKAVASYIEEVAFGTQTYEVSTCTEDINTIYQISESDSGCSYRIDALNGNAILQKRLFYSNGTENVYVSECQDSSITSPLVKTASGCIPQLSGEELFEYQQTYYLNSNGDKTIVISCSPTTTVLPITEDMKIYDYDSCPNSIDLSSGRAYQRYKIFVDIMGVKNLFSSCQIDSSKYYSIIDTPIGCNVRNDFSGGISIVQNRQVYNGSDGKEIEARPCYDTPKTFNHQKMVSTCSPVYDAETSSTFTTRKAYYLDDNSNVTFITCCLMDMSTSEAVITSDKKREYTATDTIDFDNSVAYKRYREYIILSGDNKEYISPVTDDLTNPMPIAREYTCDFFNDNVSGTSYRQFQEVYYRDGARKVVSDCQKDLSKSFAHITDAKYCVPQITNRIVYKKESTYFLDETSERVVVKACALNGQEESLDPSLIEKNYGICPPRFDFTNMLAIASYKEQVIFDDVAKNLSDCIEDPIRTYAISDTDSGCSYRIDLSGGKAIQQRKMLYNSGVATVFITECQDSNSEFPFIKSTATCSPTVSEDGTSFNEMEETYFIDSTGVKRTVIQCSANGNVEPIPESSKIKDFSKCEPEIVVEEMAAYGKYELYAKAGAENVLVQACTVDPSVIYAIDEDYASCPVKIDPVNGQAIQYKKLFYRKGNEDVYVSACIASDTSYAIQESVTGCDYRIDLPNNLATAQKRRFYSASGSINYTTDCYDTEETAAILSSDEFCPQNLSDNGLYLVEAKESYYYNSQAERKVVQACTPTGILIPVPEESKIKNYENCSYLLDMDNQKANPQYQLFVHHANDQVMIQGCMPDYETEYDLLQDFSNCEPKVDLVNDEITETSQWYFSKGDEDVTVTSCIESNIKYPIESRSDICEVLPIENDAGNVIEQARLYYIDSQDQLQYVSACEPTNTILPITYPICEGDERYLHNYVSGESFLAVQSKYGEQIIEECHISPSHASMTHFSESCGWTHDDSKYRSTLKTREFFTDVDSGVKVYLNACHASNTYISYAYKGIYTGAGDGGHSGNCAGGLYWHPTPDNTGYSCSYSSCAPFSCSATATYSIFKGDISGLGLGAFLTGNKIAEYRQYLRPDNSNYYIWQKNACQVKNHKISNVYATPYGCSASGFSPYYLNTQSANDFAAQYFGWFP